MRPPRWLWPTGLLEHVIVGAFVTVILMLLGSPPRATFVAILAMGIAHEWADGDFTVEAGAPINGILDTLAFCPLAITWWLLS